MKTMLSIVLILSFGLCRAQQALVFDVDKYVCKLTPEKIRSISGHLILVDPELLPTHKRLSIMSPESLVYAWKHPTLTEYPARTFDNLRLCEESNTIATDSVDPLWTSLSDKHPHTWVQQRAKEFREIRNGSKPVLHRPKSIGCRY